MMADFAGTLHHMQLLKDSKKVMIFSLEAATFFSILTIGPSPRQAVGRVHRKDKKPILSSLANPVASAGECARCGGSIIIQKTLTS
jgi:hypothetical protein